MWTKTPGSMKAAPTYVRLFCIYVISSTYSIYFFLYKINLVLYLPVHLYLYTMYVLNKGAFSYHWLCKVWSFTLYDVNRKKSWSQTCNYLNLSFFKITKLYDSQKGATNYSLKGYSKWKTLITYPLGYWCSIGLTADCVNVDPGAHLH